MSLPGRATTQRFYAGDDHTFPTYIIGGGTEDLSVYTWAAQWRAKRDDTEFQTMALDLSQQAIGRITPSLTAAQTATMVGAGVWDLQSTLAGKVRTRIEGATVCLKDVTRLG